MATRVNMAHALFDVLPGIPVFDNQTALAVQTLLDSHATSENGSTDGAANALEAAAAVSGDDEDLFQCGKCKKQFTSILAFINHKREPCGGVSASPAVSSSSGVHSDSASAPLYETATSQHSLQVSNGYTTTVATSSLQQVVLNEAEFLSLTGLHTPTALAIADAAAASYLTPIGGANLPRGTSTEVSQASQLIGGAQSLVLPLQVCPLSGAPTNATPSTLYTMSPVKSRDPKFLSKSIEVKSEEKDGSRATLTLSIVAEMPPDETAIQPTTKRKMKTGKQEAKRVTKLECVYCTKRFAKNFDLQQHVRSHTGEKPFQCIVCGRAFAQKSNVKKHMQTHKVWPDGLLHTLPKPQQPIKVESNMNTVAEPEQIGIDEQDLGTDGPKEIAESGISPSAQVTPPISAAYLCVYCNQIFQTYCKLKTHLKMHKSEQVYRCVVKECGQTFQDLDSFLEHTKMHEDEMSYRCHVCSRSFKSLNDLGVHQYTHNLEPKKTQKKGTFGRFFRCPKCMNRYSTPEALDHHMSTNLHHYACPHCTKVFLCERYLRRHLPAHGAPNAHTCYVCDKSFKTDHYLRSHLLIHSGEKPFSCWQCNASFNRKDKLKRHLMIHEPVKRYKCPFRAHTGCSKEFHRPDKLKAHILTHSGLKPFQCNECGKAFSRRAHLREHQQQIHSGQEKKFACETCNQKFVDEDKLKGHKCSGKSKASRNSRRNVKTTRRPTAKQTKACGKVKLEMAVNDHQMPDAATESRLEAIVETDSSLAFPTSDTISLDKPDSNVEFRETSTAAQITYVDYELLQPLEDGCSKAKENESGTSVS